MEGKGGRGGKGRRKVSSRFMRREGELPIRRTSSVHNRMTRFDFLLVPNRPEEKRVRVCSGKVDVSSFERRRRDVV